MKKRIFSIIALALVCAFTLSACDGCTNLQPINFTNAFNGGSGLKEENPVSGYQETLTYDVSYAKSHEGYAINSALNSNEDVKFTFEKGKYVSTLTVYSSFNEVLGGQLESDILSSLEDNQKQAYHLHTEFSVDVTYEITGRELYSTTDTIVSDVYFCDSTLSYAPVYSLTNANYTNFYYSTNSEAVKVKTISEIKYNKNNYTISFTVNDNKPTITTKEYNFKSIIDNAQLLFALRNFSVELDSTQALPVVASNYGEAVPLVVRNNQKNIIKYEQDNPLSYNYDSFDGDVEISHLLFYRNQKNETGAMQHVYIQNKVDNSPLAYKSLLVRYVEPLTSYRTIVPMGVLVYNLNSVDVEYN